MSFYNRILFPIDLTEASPKITPHVKEIADKFGAEIHMIYVAHVTQYYDGLYISPCYVGDFETEVVKAARTRLDEFQAEVIDLIIMGHSRKGIKRVIMGSVAGHVVKWSPVPVMIVSPHNSSL